LNKKANYRTIERIKSKIKHNINDSKDSNKVCVE
jgi:hypothetical protein